MVSIVAERPLGEMNTTPLIDVLLVLLVMFVITIPVATHSLDVTLPSGDRPAGAVQPDRNLLAVERGGALLWNGRAVNDGQLAWLLADVRRRAPEPQVEFRPDADAAYERTAQVLRLVDQSHIANFGFSGNERFASFGR